MAIINTVTNGLKNLTTTTTFAYKLKYDPFPYKDIIATFIFIEYQENHLYRVLLFPDVYARSIVQIYVY